MKEISISKNEDGIKLAKYLKKTFPSMPESLLYKLLRKKYFVLNDIKADGKENLKTGDKLKIFLADDTYEKYNQKKGDNEIVIKSIDKKRIIYEDSNIILYNKEKGLLSQGDKSGDISVNSILLSYVKNKDKLFTPSIVNRLDRNTSGIIIFAKTYIAAREISEMIKNQKLKKYYRAYVNGVMKKDKGTLIHYFKKDEKNNKVDIIDKEKDGYIKVELKYNVIKKEKDMTVLDVDLITGKSHQIRAQLSHIGHPIICDKKYMDSPLYKKNVERFKMKSQELCCYKIRFDIFASVELKNLDNKIFMLEGNR